MLPAVYLRTKWDNKVYTEIELHSSEVLSILEMVLWLLCRQASLSPFFVLRVLLLAWVICRALADLNWGQKQTMLPRIPGWIHDTRAEPWAVKPCSSALPLSFLTLMFPYPFTHSPLSFSSACFSKWVPRDVLHEVVNSSVRKAASGLSVRAQENTENVSLFLVSFVSSWFSTAGPETCYRAITLSLS